ncbi:hypothetical protein FB451DRAFT_1178162 [Mycena latifolia]|nr:hypothetical protein FB451DRAFT_1178162 [Mycena latifolia]
MSPFASKLGRSYCPKDEEVGIKSLLVHPSLQLERLDEIADMQKAIDKLKEHWQRDSLAVYMEGYKALISLVRRLPLDIVQAIFMACIPTRNCVMSAREAPVLLGRICNAWRGISLSTPRLKLAQRLETTKTWLGRSGHCALSISLESGVRYSRLLEESASPYTDLFLQALIPFASHWQHIHFTIPSTVLQSLSHLAETDVPMLKSVALYAKTRHGSNSPEWILFGMLRGSKISSFSVSGSYFRPPGLPLQWNQLTVLSITGTSWASPSLSAVETISGAISRCPEPRSCKLIINGRTTAELQSNLIELAFLHTLELYYLGTSEPFSCLLERLSMPELRKFSLLRMRICSLNEPIGKMDTLPAPLAHLFAVSTHLESLEIAAYPFLKSSRLDIFRSLSPTMQRLEITDGLRRMPPTAASTLDDEALALITAASGFPALSCPALLVSRCHSISDAALLRFIASRMADGPHPTLKRVDIKFYREIQLEIMPHVQSLIETGLKVAITHLPPTKRYFHPGTDWLMPPKMRQA